MTFLHVTDGCGSHRYYINGRRKTREAWHDMYSEALRGDRLNCSRTIRKNGAWHHYTNA